MSFLAILSHMVSLLLLWKKFYAHFFLTRVIGFTTYPIILGLTINLFGGVSLRQKRAANTSPLLVVWAKRYIHHLPTHRTMAKYCSLQGLTIGLLVMIRISTWIINSDPHHCRK